LINQIDQHKKSNLTVGVMLHIKNLANILLLR